MIAAGGDGGGERVGRMRRIACGGERPGWIAFHRFAAWAIVVVLLLTTAVGLLADLFGQFDRE